jgi:O-antigen ligase
MIQYLGTWLIAIAAVYPVAFRLADIGGKPVDAVLSDFLYLLILLTPPRKLLTIPAGVDLRILATVRVSAFACIAYSLGLSLVGYATSTEFSRVVSAIKFVKPMSFVLLGTYLAMIFPPVLLLRRMGIAFGLVVLATMGTAFTIPAFPRCAWGQWLFGYETYGYPNAPMSFYGVMIPLLIAVGDCERRRTLRLIYRGAMVIGIVLVVASLSRSSTIAMIVATSIYLFATGRGYIPVATVIVAGVFAVAGVGLMKIETNIEAVEFLQGAIERRFLETVEREDTFSGRGDIWLLAIDLSSRKPVFGYMFEPFSRYSVIFDTAHQQYLEVLYKTGVIGTALYLWVLLSGVYGLWHLQRHAEARRPAWYLVWAALAALLGTLVGNLSQPNLTYSLTGNTLFLMLGMLLSRHGAADLVEAPPVPVPLEKPVRLEIRNVQPGPAPT